MEPAQSSGAVPDALKVLILSGPLARSDKDALKSYIQTNLQLLYPHREAKVDLALLNDHSLRSRLEDLAKLSAFVEKHDKHDMLRYDWVLPLFYLPPLTEPMYLDIEEEAVNITKSIAVEASKAAKHVLFTTIAQSITKPSIPSINKLNEEIKILGTDDGSHLLNISALLRQWNNPFHSQTYSLTAHRIAQHIAFKERSWDNEEKLGLYHLSEQIRNIIPSDSELCDSGFSLEKTAKPVQLYRPFLTQGCAQFIHLQRQQARVRVELDIRCAQNMAKDYDFNPLQSMKINNSLPNLGSGHSPSIIDQAFQNLNTALRGIPDISINTSAASNREYTPGHSQLNHPGTSITRPSRITADSFITSLSAEVEVARMRREEMPMGADGIRRPATISGMWRLELRRPMERPVQRVNTNSLASAQVVANPFRKGRGRVIGEVVEPVAKPVVEPAKRTCSTAFSAAGDEDEDEDGVVMAERRQRLRHDEVMLLAEIVRDRPARAVERPSRAGRGANGKYVKRRKTKGRK